MKHSPARELQGQEIAGLMDGRIRQHELENDRCEAYLPSPCVQNHAPNLSWLADGTLACVWFGGTMEGMGDISIWLSRLEPGSDRWGPAVRLTFERERSEQNPILFAAPDGRLHLFHTSQIGGRQDGCEIVQHISSGIEPIFEKSARIGDFRGIFIRQPLTIGPNGQWLMAGFRCRTEATGGWTGSEDTSLVLVSSDSGRSWNLSEVPDSLGAVHMCPVAGEDDRMVAFFRDRFARSVRRSVSRDGGLSWTAPEATLLANNNSSIQAMRRRDGRIAIVLNPINAEMSSERRGSLYDEIEGIGATSAAIWGVPRAPLSVFHSSDDGLTFTDRRDLEHGPGHCLTNNSESGQNREFSYPTIVEDERGDLHIAFTYHRRAIKYVRIKSE